MMGQGAAVRLGACLALGLLVSPGAGVQAESLTFYGKGKTYVAYGKANLTAVQSRALSEFRSKRHYFAAFAASAGNDAWGASAGYHDQKLAEKVALAICKAHAKGAPCKVIAAVLPKGIPANSRNASGLSAGAENYYRKEFLKQVKRQKPGRYAAFAIGNRVAGINADAPTASEAKQKARRACEQAALNNLRKVEIKIRNALSRLGADKCKVVEVRKS